MALRLLSLVLILGNLFDLSSISFHSFFIDSQRIINLGTLNLHQLQEKFQASRWGVMKSGLTMSRAEQPTYHSEMVCCFEINPEFPAKNFFPFSSFISIYRIFNFSQFVTIVKLSYWIALSLGTQIGLDLKMPTAKNGHHIDFFSHSQNVVLRIKFKYNVASNLSIVRKYPVFGSSV